MKNTDIQTLENLLYNCKLSKKYFIKKDEIKGKTIALASTGENESVNIHSNFMELINESGEEKLINDINCHELINN